MNNDIGQRVAEAMAEIFEEIPKRIAIRRIVQDAYGRLSEVAGKEEQASSIINEKLTEVLREIATYAVEEFTRRTGQPFLWQDEPEDLPDPEPLMSFGIEVKDGKGNVTF